MTPPKLDAEDMSSVKGYGKMADPSLQVDVDEMMLDYFLFMAIKALLQEYGTPVTSTSDSPQRRHADSAIELLDSFIAVFKLHHPCHCLPRTVQFRLALLKFTTLFTRRLVDDHTNISPATLGTLRRENKERAAAWKSHKSPPSPLMDNLPLPNNSLPPFSQELPVSIVSAQGYRESLLQRLGVIDARADYGSEQSTSLLDLLPSFVLLSAKVSMMGDVWRIRERWMQLAANFMINAALEQYLAFQAKGDEVLMEAFAWGANDGNHYGPDSDGGIINAMFVGDGDTEIREEWEKIRLESISMFLPSREHSMEEHLKILASRVDVKEFEQKLMSFLINLQDLQEAPVLVQLEVGQLEGFSLEETEQFMLRTGLRG